MAVDRNGTKIHPGDIVNIPCVVVGIDAHDEFINVAVETVEPMYPGRTKQKILLNDKQLELQVRLGDSDVNLDVDNALTESGILKKGRDKPAG